MYCEERAVWSHRDVEITAKCECAALCGFSHAISNVLVFLLDGDMQLAPVAEVWQLIHYFMR